MTKKELQEYYWLQRNIQKLEDKLLELETKATKMTTCISYEPKAKTTILANKDNMANIVGKIIEVQNKINNKLYESYEILTKMEEAIGELPEREKYLIRLRYIDCKSWEQIAVDMNYSWRQVHNIHAEALKQLA